MSILVRVYGAERVRAHQPRHDLHKVSAEFSIYRNPGKAYGRANNCPK